AKLREDMAQRGEELTALESRWERERAALQRIGELKQRLESLRTEAEVAQREGQLEKASRLLYAEIPALERELQQAEQEESGQQGERMVNEQVTEADIAGVVAAWTGIPVDRLTQGET